MLDMRGFPGVMMYQGCFGFIVIFWYGFYFIQLRLKNVVLTILNMDRDVALLANVEFITF